MPASVKQLRDNANNLIYPKIAKEGLVEPINSNDVGIEAIEGLESSTVQGALQELASASGNTVEIVKTASGSVINVSDSADYRLLGLKLYGKSVQDGTPTPEAPVEIESVGDGGNIAIQITGANLFDITKSIYPNPETFSISIESENTFTVTALKEGTGLEFYIRVPIDVPVGTTVSISGQSSDGYQFNLLNRQIDGSLAVGELTGKTMARKEGLRLFAVCNPFGGSKINVSEGQTVTCTDVTVSIGSTALPWESYKSQTLTYPTPNGLPGIPVESGGNYTDAEGQQWVCDEVDFGRGKYTKKIDKLQLQSQLVNINNARQKDDNYFGLEFSTNISADLMCTSSVYVGAGKSINGDQITYVPLNGCVVMGLLKSLVVDQTIDGVKAYLSKHPVYIIYILSDPVDTDLTPEQLTAYAALTTYKPNTTITTDSDPAAGVEVKYLTDSGVAEVLDYYASKADLDGKQDNLTGTAGQFVGFGADGDAEAQTVTAADVGAVAADGTTAMTGNFNVGGHRVTNVGAPTSAGDAVRQSDLQAVSDEIDAIIAGTTPVTIPVATDVKAGIVRPGEHLSVLDDGTINVTWPDLSGYATTADVAETYAPKALKFTGTFTAAGWTSATGGFSQAVNVAGLTADDEPIIDLNSTATDADTFNGQLEAFGLVSNFTTGDGTLTAVVLGDSTPTVDIPIHGMVVY